MSNTPGANGVTGAAGINGQDQTLVSSDLFNFVIGDNGTNGGTGGSGGAGSNGVTGYGSTDLNGANGGRGGDGGRGGNGANVDLSITGITLDANVDGSFLPIMAYAIGGNGADGGAGGTGGKGGNGGTNSDPTISTQTGNGGNGGNGGDGGTGGDGGDAIVTASGNNITGGSDFDFLYVDLNAYGGLAGYGGSGGAGGSYGTPGPLSPPGNHYLGQYGTHGSYGSNGLAGNEGNAHVTFDGNNLISGDGTDVIVIYETAISMGEESSVTLSNNVFDCGADTDVLSIAMSAINPSGTASYDMHNNQFIGGDGANDMLDFSLNWVGMNIDLNAGTVDFADSGPNMVSYNNTVTGFEDVFGTYQNDIIKGDAHNNTIGGSAGDDLLTGGGGQDLYYFDFNSGQDTITDFESGVDILDVHSYGMNAADLAANISNDTNGNAVIQLSQSDSITLENVTSQTLIDNLLQGGSDFIV